MRALVADKDTGTPATTRTVAAGVHGAAAIAFVIAAAAFPFLSGVDTADALRSVIAAVGVASLTGMEPVADFGTAALVVVLLIASQDS